MGTRFYGFCEMCFVELDCLEPCSWTKGGSHAVENRRVSCPKCNQSTSTLTFDEEGKARRAMSVQSARSILDSSSTDIDHKSPPKPFPSSPKQMKFQDTETVAI